LPPTNPWSERASTLDPSPVLAFGEVFSRFSLLFVLVACACAREEPKVSPLGLGPLAVAEYAARREAPPDTSAAPPEPNTEGREPAPPLAQPTASTSTSSEPPSPADAGAFDGGASPPVTPTTLAGLYLGTDTTTTTFPPMSPQSVDDPEARTRVEAKAQGELMLVIVDSSTNQDLCQLKGLLTQGTATILPGQPCFEAEERQQTAQVKAGTARFRDGELSLELVLDVRIDNEDFSLAGRIDYRFVGKKER
jgi:hypothetical protein